MPATIPVRFAAAFILIACTLLFAACDDPEEDVTDGDRSSAAASTSAPSLSADTPSPSVQTVAPSATLAATPPPDWKQYENTEMGISLRYPPDLEVRSESGPAQHQEYGGQDVDIRSPEQIGRGFVISTFEMNPYNLTLDEFADEFYCARDKRETILGGERAIACGGDGMTEERPTLAVVTQRDGRFYAISATVEVSPEEFSAIAQSFRFLP